MAPNKIVNHAEAVNLARRYSAQNENDLVMEDYSTDSPPMRNKKMSHDECQELSKHLVHLNALPTTCAKYQDVVSSLKRRDTDTAHPTQWMS
mmetsp:Transcript_19503/g.47094  ORF Transcript_19503/g.47094 Transcript_19503/m.47094 type:complete len:92 (+) Transcript_19503:245-520(+)|eukprot:CAMPEP_0113456118 /NCGR_PEP_ID=MMETSP0014_2-20120614/8722_1 /TAXON_ID=2857 /ORGANISM="Nitzschia sp." /LENGTH=91 /DNA_ID=CAMNT_0000347561 /DNA_START=168 /DNA_END=443 /DNA_ORIENTATION=- /assembly_acc=CAM_ASM_000159